ncbi:MAG: HAD family hydrolase [Verrucomicrobiota bacterium]|jgi:beta-phosphoglucomutase family hydrolase
MPTLESPQALIFDCDGTVAHTMPLHWRAWQSVTLRYGIDFPETRFYALGGVPGRNILRMLFEEQGIRGLDPVAVAKEKEEAYLEFLHEVGPVEPVVEIARRHLGVLPMAIATGGSRPGIPTVLRHLGIHDWFAAIVTSEDVVRQKPAPDIFLEAARQLGVDPARCRAFEDTDLGMESIRAAGMEAIDVRLFPDYPRPLA